MTETHPVALAPAWAALTSATEVDRATGSSWLDGLGFNRAAPADLLLRLLDAGRHWFLYREDLPDAVLDAAVVHPARQVRLTVAEAGHLSPAQWDRLIAASPGAPRRGLFTELAEQCLKARARPGGGRGTAGAPHPDAAPPTTPDEIEAMATEAPDIEPGDVTTGLWWIGALHEDAAAMRQLASSPKLLVRRSVARAPRLPADVVALLARDEDRVVRLFLAESCDDAPPAMLLEVAAWWDGSLSFPGRPRNHPNFPRDGLLRLAADPNPRLRALALDDPASTAAHAEQLSRDSDPRVRRAAARDPRTAPEALVRLSADPDRGVRETASTNPALPADELVTRLLDPHCAETAEIAARNPAVPVAAMHHMVTLATAHADAQGSG
ncbi:hypothetical protein ACFU7Y_21655 [Kitasatospora sp. NPDC057542]|uniref:hypothetical protein n=1 Tax=Kitasatospora sp. NPDC057542 TaxID=3346162 RepID=UPI0036B7CA67